MEKQSALNRLEQQRRQDSQRTPMLCEVRIGGSLFDAVLDTGASVSVIALDVLAIIHKCPSFTLDLSTTNLCGAGGTALKSVGYCLVPLQMGGVTAEVGFHIVESLTNGVIIGTNILSQLGVKLNPKLGQATINDSILPATMFKQELVYSVSLPHSLNVPPKSSVNIICNIDSLDKQLFATVELFEAYPLVRNPRGVHIAQSLNQVLESDNIQSINLMWKRTLSLIDCQISLVSMEVETILSLSLHLRHDNQCTYDIHHLSF